MRDLAKQLREAKHRAAEWERATLCELIVAVLSTSSGATLDWDIGAGEEWARVVVGGEPVVIFRVDLPLIFATREQIKGRVLDEMRKVAVVVEHPHFDEPIFSVDLETFREVFHAHEWRLEVCSPACFSVNDLHWMTAT